MVTLNEVYTQGLKDGTCPPCHKCEKTFEQMKEEGNAFLVCVKGDMICGKCAMEMMKVVFCPKCQHNNTGMDKFCGECGEKLK